MAKAIVVLGLLFGDEGKGGWTDALTRYFDAKLVVRFNGGAQCAHNVITPEGKHHTFSQFGSGHFAGAATHLSRFVVFNPVFFFPEALHLAELQRCMLVDATAQVTIERDAIVTTPFHGAMNRVRESARRGNRHGSVGLGVGETRGHFLSHPEETVFVRDFTTPKVLHEKLHAIHARFAAEAKTLDEVRMGEESAFVSPMKETEHFVSICTALMRYVRVVGPEFLDAQMKQPGTVLFEGAQGVLLDETHGFQPYTTWTDTTLGNVDKLGVVDPHVIGLTRAYATRHGPGPLPTEVPGWALEGEHNAMGTWQGAFRVGHLDLELLRHAIQIVDGRVNALAVSGIDQVGETDIPFCVSHKRPVDRAPEDWDAKFKFTDDLMAAQPLLTRARSRPHLLEMMTAALARPVQWVSSGPRTQDKRKC